MKKLKKVVNTTYYIILVVIGLSFLIFTTLTVVFIFNSHVTINLTGENDIVNDTIIAITGIVSAFLVYLGFRLQAKQIEISSKEKMQELKIQQLNKDFDRYVKLLEGIEKSEARVRVTLYDNDKAEKPRFGNEGINLFISYMEADYMEDINLDLNEAEKTLSVYFTSISFILAGIQSFKPVHTEYYNILKTTFIYTTPLLYNQLFALSQLEEDITDYKTRQNGLMLFDNIIRLLNQLESIE